MRDHRDRRIRPPRRLAGALSILLIISSVAIEWLFLTGSLPSSAALAEAFLPTAPAAPMTYFRPSFQTGVIFPRWGQDAYSPLDPNYGVGLDEIQRQTGARWIELTINLHQSEYNSTDVSADPLSTTPDSLAQGIRAAHAHGFKVFIEPLLSIVNPSPEDSHWAGAVNFPRGSKDIARWFDRYWQALAPYMRVAQETGAEQMAIGAEMADMENAPANYWYWLIEQARETYSGRLTYDTNYPALALPVHPWMRTPSLAAIGISLYITLARRDETVSIASIPERWAAGAGALLDGYATRLGKPLFISEIGYRNNADALFHPYARTSDAPPDPQLQAALYNAALLYVLSDARLDGIYFWAWSLPPFSPNWLPAAHVLKSWYQSPLA